VSALPPCVSLFSTASRQNASPAYGWRTFRKARHRKSKPSNGCLSPAANREQVDLATVLRPLASVDLSLDHGLCVWLKHAGICFPIAAVCITVRDRNHECPARGFYPVYGSPHIVGAFVFSCCRKSTRPLEPYRHDTPDYAQPASASAERTSGLFRTARTVAGCHSPPRAVGMLRATSSAAILRSDTP